MPAQRVVFPFLRATSTCAKRKRRVPSARFQPNSDQTMNCCQGSSLKDSPDHFPFECLRN